MPDIRMFPPAVIALQRELASGLHPTLTRMLSEKGDDWEVRLANIAHYCGVAIDAVFSSDEEIARLCEGLLIILETKRERPQGIIVVN